MRFIFSYKQSLFCTIFNVKENFFVGIQSQSFLYIFLIKTLCNSITKYNRKTKFSL